MISDNTLYYFLSTIAQSVAAITALLAIFIQFKITQIKDFLLGEGTLIRNLSDSGASSYQFESNCKKKFVNALIRKDLKEVESSIEYLAKIEKEKNIKTNIIHNELQIVLERYKRNYKQISELRIITKKTVAISMLTLLFSLTSLSLVDSIKLLDFGILTLIINGLMAFLSILYSVKGIFLGLQERE